MQTPRIRSRLLRCGVALFAIVALVVCLHHDAFCKDPERLSDAITIVDIDGSTAKLSVEDLRRMPQVTERECICVGEVSGFIGIFDFKGVRLTDLLEKADAASTLSRYEQENTYIVFRGTDGYQVIASWTELTQTPDGNRAMVIIEKDGKPLGATAGKFRLLFPADKYVGRSVKCLETIEIHSAPGVKARPAAHDKKPENQQKERRRG